MYPCDHLCLFLLQRKQRRVPRGYMGIDSPSWKTCICRKCVLRAWLGPACGVNVLRIMRRLFVWMANFFSLLAETRFRTMSAYCRRYIYTACSIPKVQSNASGGFYSVTCYGCTVIKR